ncbi:hypothetical protein CCYA_CCYA16G4218 [Cyanidiococcus yangmingshanensis]|nr:hypothetical protein CCYA_CCYA16G4218 [Cyanidiococcus yangmingshanensis]
MRRKQLQPQRRLGENDGDVADTAVKVERETPSGTLHAVRNAKPLPGAWLDVVPLSANDPDWFGLGILNLIEDSNLESVDQSELQLRCQAALGDDQKPLARWSLRWVASSTSSREAKPRLAARKRKAPDSLAREDGVLTVQLKAPLVEALWRLTQKRIATLVFIQVPVSGWLVLLHRECCLSTSLRQESTRRDLQRLITFWHPEAALTEASLRERETPNSSTWRSLWRFRSARGLVEVSPGPQHTDQRAAWGEASWVYEIMRRLPADSSTHQGSELERETSALAPGPEPAVEFEVRPEVPGLRPHLRPYQCRAVSWMLQRERLGIAFEHLQPLSIPDWRGDSFSPLLYEPFESVATTASSSEPNCSSLRLVYGGMLCDEMGLGKTVELLACMLLQRQEKAEQASLHLNGIESTDLNRIRQAKRTCFECGVTSAKPLVHCLLVGRARKRYFCDDCVEKMRTESYQPSRATLIVCPTVILGQWELEIRKHLLDSSVDVVVYRGLRRETYQRCKRLASADIVLTTYDALRADVNRAQDQILQERNLRYAKRYQVAPTPLSRIEWERICLDEAQMIHGGVAAAAAMALKLRAHKRWCITGTPVRRSVDDLEGLVRFLRFEPFDEPDRWRKWLIRPCERNGVGASARLAQVIRALSWRSEKVDVQREIGLLPQFEVMQTLSLGPVERHYYMRQHETCASFVGHLLNSRVAKHLEQPGSLVKTASRRGYGLVRLVLHHLKVLRQACCHPRLAPASAGGGGLEPNIMTMDQVLDVLVQRARLECEEAQRSLVAALNGLAAIALLRGQAADAVDLYRSVLQRAQDPKQADFIEIDPLQRYHVMVNLAEVLQTRHLERSGLGMTLREAQLVDDAADLRRAYLRESRELVETARSQLLQLGEELERRAQSRARRLWWVAALEAIAAAGQERWLLDRLEEDGILQQLGATTPVSSIKTLTYILVQGYDSLEQARRALLDRLVTLPGNGASEPTDIQVRNSGNCGQCRQDMHGEPCEHCRSEELFETYERRLFAVRTRPVNATQTREPNSGERIRRLAAVITEGDGGVRLASELERTLRFIGTALRRVEGHAPMLIDAAVAEWERFALLKREFTQAHAYFRAQKDYLGALDELVMAATRITIRKPAEKVSESERRYRILEAEIEPTALSLEMDRRLAEEQLRRKKGQLIYLQHLKSACIEDLAAKSRESCPICYRTLGAELVLLPCGHCFCIECISSYLESRVYRQHSRLLPCPVCREVCNARELSFIQTTASSSCMASEPIKGSYGAKIEAVVRDLLLLQEFATRQAAEFGSHPSTNHRCVVFSQWSELLQILSTALERNSIPHIIGDIEAFRQRTDPFCVLLLPIRTGANGLNLTEARHVLLLEPLLDPAAELQAIGRVHRIGQTCSTFVHRYVVQGTVEEHVQAIGARNQWHEQHLRSSGQSRSQTRADMVDTQRLTLNDLRRMFDLDSCIS